MGGANSRQDRPQDEPPRAEEKRLHGKSGGPLLQGTLAGEEPTSNFIMGLEPDRSSDGGLMAVGSEGSWSGVL